MHNCSKVVDELLDYRVNLEHIRYCWIWGFFDCIHLYGNVLVVIYSMCRRFHVCSFPTTRDTVCNHYHPLPTIIMCLELMSP